MDELIYDCLKQIAFDGDLGCDIGRLGTFIDDYYKNHSYIGSQRQCVDESFQSFVWSLIVQEASVTVGLVPEGSSPVYIAPQPSAVRKRKKAQSESIPQSTQDPSHSTPWTLELLDTTEVFGTNLSQLREKYGSTLRIAVDHNTSYAAITGSHVRSAKLGAMAYTMLQFITRSRTEGMSMTALGAATGYDQKTIHYLAAQLLDLDLILKIRTRGISKHTCIHKYFYAKSPFYVPEQEMQKKNTKDSDVVDKDEETNEQDAPTGHSIFANDPFDTRMIGNDTFIRQRLITLLRSTPNGFYPSGNLLPALGCSNPSRSDRRLFQQRIRDFEKDGLVEKVYTPHKKNPNSRVLCVRLLEQPAEREHPETVVDVDVASVPDATPTGQRPLFGQSIHHQIVKMIHDSGTSGMTLIEISERLGNFDRRAVEQMLARFEREALPPNLTDLAVVEMIETVKREHRHKYFTLINYHSLMADIGTAGTSKALPNIDEAHLNGWTPLSEAQFLGPIESLEARLEEFATTERIPTSTVSKKVHKNPIGPDGNYIKGRPRNEWKGGVSRPRKRPKKDEDDTEGPPKPPRKGGRKRKAEEVMDAQHDAAGPVAPMVPTEQVPEQGDRQEDLETLPPARKRRRVEKPTQRTSEAPKKRGRPRKSATASAPAPLAAMDADTPSPAIGIQPQPELNDIRAEMTPVESPVTAGPGSARPAERQALPEISGVAIQQQPRQQLSEQTAAQPPRRPLEPPVDKAAPEKRVRNTEPTVEPRSPSLAPVSESGVPHGTDRLSEQPQIQNIAAISSQPRGLAVNVSYMRREKEILHLLNESNGVALINLDFLRRHMGLLDEWAKDGRQTSAPPGTLTDKRTLNVLFETMEERKLVKVTKTVIPEAGANRRAPVMVVALVGTPESALIQLLESLKAPGEQSQARSLVRKKAKEQPIVDAELVERTPQEVRMELLNDPKTAAQLFGFIDGRVARVREMYLFTLSRLMDPTTSSEFFLSKQHRILDVQYFWTDLPLSTYCSLVSAPQYYPALEEALSTEQGRAQQVGDVPSHLAGILKAKRARSRFKLYEMLDLLKHLGLVTALERSIGRNPLIAIPAHGGDQGLSLNVVSGDGPSTTIEPRYWQFNPIVPVYHFARAEGEPNLLGHRPIASVEEGVEFWLAFHKASTQADFALDPPPSDSPEQLFTGPTDVRRTLRRKQAWSTSYTLSGRQKSYLSRFVNYDNGETPTVKNPDDPDDPFNVLCYAAAAPHHAVQAYFKNVQNQMMASKEKREGKQDRGREAEARRLLGRKVSEAKERLKNDWKQAVQLACPEITVDGDSITGGPALERIRKSFFASNGNIDPQRLQGAIKAALASSLWKKPIYAKLPRPDAGAIAEEPRAEEAIVARNSSVKEILELVQKQEPIVKEKRRRGKGKAKSEEPAKRGPRFVWTPEYDELAKDATAIIAARCRSCKIMKWDAVDQLFPGVRANGVRNRIGKLRADPAVESYLLNLEQAWYRVWMEKRGTKELPDEFVESATHFDLIAHVAYLRRRFDKALLRSNVAIQPRHVEQPSLPATVSQINEEYEVEEEQREAKWGFIWNTSGDDLRDRCLYRSALSSSWHVPSQIVELSSKEDIRAEIAIKMTLETADDAYDVGIAQKILKACEDEHVTRALAHMEKYGYITKVVSEEGRRIPGRTWKFQEWQADVMNGPLNPQLYVGAEAFEEGLRKEGTQELPYVIGDGVMLALTQLVSDDKVTLVVDTSHPAKVRPEFGGDSKKVADDHLETSITIRLRQNPSEVDDVEMVTCQEAQPVVEPSYLQMNVDRPPGRPHGVSSNDPGRVMSCHKGDLASTSKWVDCEGCLDDAEFELLDRLPEAERSIAIATLKQVQAAGVGGIHQSDLLTMAKTSVTKLLTCSSTPLVFWSTCNTKPTLVSSTFLPAYTLPTPTGLVFPCRWIDINGNVIERVWEGSIRNVLGWVWNRPGITLGEVRVRLQRVLGRAEVLDLVCVLVRTRGLVAKLDGLQVGAEEIIGGDDEQLGKTYLLVNLDMGSKWRRGVSWQDGTR